MMNTTKIDESIQWFIGSILSEKGLAKNTALSYSSDLRLFFKGVKKGPYDVREDDIRAYLSTCTGKSACTTNRMLSALNAFFKFLVSEGVIVESPMQKIHKAKAEKKVPRFLTEQQMIDLIKSCETYGREADKVRLMLILLYSSGVRVSELLSLRSNMIDCELCTVRVVGKGGKERVLPIDPQIIELIRTLGITDFLFKSPRGQHPISRQRVFQVIKELGISIGVHGLSPHKIRHSFATHMLDNGANILTVQNLLGHSDISTTEIYTHLVGDKMRETVQKCHPMSQFFEGE